MLCARLAPKDLGRDLKKNSNINDCNVGNFWGETWFSAIFFGYLCPHAPAGDSPGCGFPLGVCLSTVHYKMNFSYILGRLNRYTTGVGRCLRYFRGHLMQQWRKQRMKPDTKRLILEMQRRVYKRIINWSIVDTSIHPLYTLSNMPHYNSKLYIL